MSTVESDKIFVPAVFAEIKFKEKSSVFIAQLFPAEDESVASSILLSTKKKYFDATHNCFAYRVYPNAFKYSDDGEPSGTAGLRIYNSLKHFHLFNCILIVTRYFGGTKLGVGPLGAAYYNSSVEVIQNAQLIEKHLYNRLEIKFDFSLSKIIYHLADEFKLIIESTNYLESIVMIGKILSNHSEKFIEKLESATSGKVIVNKLQEDILA